MGQVDQLLVGAMLVAGLVALGLGAVWMLGGGVTGRRGSPPPRDRR